MLYINLEYQLFLILVLIFASFPVIQAFVVRPQKMILRAFEFAFAVPLFMTCASFLISPYNKEAASVQLVLAHLVLVLLCTSILFIHRESDSIKLLYLLPFVLAAALLVITSSPLNIAWHGVFYILGLVLVLANLILLLQSILQKETNRIPAYLGLFMLASALGIWLLSGGLSLESLFLLAAGYVSCIVYTYKNSLGVFFSEYRKNKEYVEHMNNSIHTEVIRRVEEIERSNRKLLELSKTDSLTGLYVKTAVVKTLEAHLERSPQTPMSVLMFDIDRFKQINDSMGHQLGDRCIRALSNMIHASFRKDDTLGRYGGDEFMVLLPATSPVKAYLIADRFRQQVQSKSDPQITISAGISSYPEDGQTAAVLIDEADKALYASKQRGRNSVTMYSSLDKGV